MSVVYQQLPLDLHLRAEATFDNFVSAGNEALLHTLCQTDEPYVYLWGDEASGKTHVLQALCHQAYQDRITVSYIPLADEEVSDPAILLGLETMGLVCLDDIETIAGRADWELGLFNLFNRLRERGGRLVVAACDVPNTLPFGLPDLVSRLNWGAVYQLHTLHDRDKIAALQMRATQLGMELSSGVAEYMLKHSPRDMAHLFGLLARLDTASLTQQRRLTIPFVKHYL